MARSSTSTRVQEIEPFDQQFCDEQAERPSSQRSESRPASCQGYVAEQFAAARRQISERCDHAMRQVEQSCLEALLQMESSIQQLRGENERLLGQVGRSAGTGESPPVKGGAWYQSAKPVINSVLPSPAILAVKPAIRPAALDVAESVWLPAVPLAEADGADGDHEAEQELPRPRLKSKSKLLRSQTRRSAFERAAQEAHQQRRVTGHKPPRPDGRAAFLDVQAMKERVKEAIMKPEYNVANFYKKTGVFQAIARNAWFETVTLWVTLCNAIYIAVAMDHNTAAVMMEADPIWIVSDNFFCGYFSGELLIRFVAFVRKRDCLQDGWFVFDSLLVTLMVIETWIITIVILITNDHSASFLGNNASIFRLVRLLRLTRMARLARLCRAMPELMILIKGVVIATRTVFFTLLLLVILVYVFALAFRQLAEGTDVGAYRFPTVPDSIAFLLTHGIMAEVAQTLDEVGAENGWLEVLLIVFTLLSSLWVMNMLIGVLCEVVSVVSSVEKEQMTVDFVKNRLMTMLQSTGFDADGNMCISKTEFESLLLNPRAARMVQEVGVDVVGLVDFSDFIFKDGAELSFGDFMELVLQLRGTNTATVKDIVDLRRFVLCQLTETRDSLVDLVKDVFVQSLSDTVRGVDSRLFASGVAGRTSGRRDADSSWPRPSAFDEGDDVDDTYARPTSKGVPSAWEDSPTSHQADPGPRGSSSCDIRPPTPLLPWQPRSTPTGMPGHLSVAEEMG